MDAVGVARAASGACVVCFVATFKGGLCGVSLGFRAASAVDAVTVAVDVTELVVPEVSTDANFAGCPDEVASIVPPSAPCLCSARALLDCRGTEWDVPPASGSFLSDAVLELSHCLLRAHQLDCPSSELLSTPLEAVFFDSPLACLACLDAALAILSA